MQQPMAAAGPPLLPRVLNNATSKAKKIIKDPTSTVAENERIQNKDDDSGPKVAQGELPSVEEGGEGKAVTRREFFWDEWLSYIASAIVALSLIDLSVEFVATSRQGILCDVNVTFTFGRDRYAFVNSYCARFLPLGQYYTLFTLIQGIVLLAPHYIWLSVFSGYFELFYALVGMLKRLKERGTGEYHPRNSAIIKKLHEEFLSKEQFGNRILIGYRVKLTMQALCACIFLLSCGLVFSDFGTDITCPSEDMPPDETFGRIRCVYGRLYFLSFIQVANLVLLGLGLAAIGVGILMMFFKPHIEALGFEEQAEFTYNAGIHHSHYQPKTTYYLPFSPFHIKTDLDFMLVRLFASDTGYGKIYKDVQVCDNVAQLLEADFKDLNSYSHIRLELQARVRDVKDHFQGLGVILNDQGYPQMTNLQTGATVDAFIASLCCSIHDTSEVRGMLKPGEVPKPGGEEWHTEDTPRRAVIDICFHPHSYAFIISRYFEKVLVLHLDPNFYSPESLVKYNQYAGNLYTLRVPANVLALPINETIQLTDKIKEFLQEDEIRFEVPFIIVSGVDDHIKGATVSQLLEHFMLTPYLSNGAILVILSPESVEGNQVKSFQRLQLKSTRNFRKDETILEHLQNLQSGNGHSAPQSGNGHSAPQSGNGHSAPQSGNGHSAPQSGNGHSAPHSHSMKCGSTRCVFHMSAYQYEKETQSPPHTQTGHPRATDEPLAAANERRSAWPTPPQAREHGRGVP